MKRIVLAVFFVVLPFCLKVRANPLYYNVESCASPGVNCTGIGSINAPPSGFTGPTNAEFQTWFSSIPGGSTGSYSWSITDYSPFGGGVEIGRVRDLSILIVTSFVFFSGNVICCTDDRLQLNDINDNGLIAGFQPGLSPFGGFVSYCCGPGFASGQQPLSITYLSQPPGYHGFVFSAINDNNDVLDQEANGSQFLLVPSPEPRAVLSLATAVGIALLAMRRRIFERKA